MKQVAQRLRDGSIEVLEVPPPFLRPHGILVDVRASLLSAGTERSKVETGRKSLLGKARSRPDQVRQVIEKAQREGLLETVAAVRNRLQQPEPLGYSAAGVVLAVGNRVRDLAVGDRVACGGAEFASHADVDYVPGNLCVRLPDEVAFGDGAFATVGAIAMQGVRQADPRLGERIAVIGLGLVGQLAGQLLKATGCRVVGVDLSEKLVGTALEMGAIDDGVPRAQLDMAAVSRLGGCDAVLIAAATRSDDPVALAANLCRDRGRVVVVGDVGMQVPRAPYYEKELDLRLSRSYGPGRYDAEYEERGLDYPIGYVRWTERRNMEAFLDLVGQGKVNVTGLVRERLPVEDAAAAYERLLAGEDSSLGILIEYGPTPLSGANTARAENAGSVADGASRVADFAVSRRVGLIGAGSFASKVVIPGLKAAGFELGPVASASGLSAHSAHQRFGFERADTVDAILADVKVGLVAIVTRHSSHAELAERAMRAGKAVFVEKPPCLTSEELERLRTARADTGAPLFVGFNRRHAPLAKRMREHVFREGVPLQVLIRVNTGSPGTDHWLDDEAEGGGRLLGEACHFVDLACWLVGDRPVRVGCVVDPRAPTAALAKTFTITLAYGEGSVATIVYGTLGASGIRKEYLEAHSDGRSAVLDDFRSLSLLDGRHRKRLRRRRQDKGHSGQFESLASALLREDGDARARLDPLDSMAATLAALRSAEAGRLEASLAEQPDRG